LVEIEFSESEDFMIFRKLFAVLLLCSAASVFAAEDETITNYDSLRAVQKDLMKEAYKEAASEISKAKLGVDVTDTNEAKKGGFGISVSVGESPFVAEKRGLEALAITKFPFPLKGTPEKPKVLMYVNTELQTASKKLKAKPAYNRFASTYKSNAARAARDEGDYMSLFKAAFAFRVMQSMILITFPDIQLSQEKGQADGANPLDLMLANFFSDDVIDKLNAEAKAFVDEYGAASGSRAVYAAHKALEEVLNEVQVSVFGKRDPEEILKAAEKDARKIPFPIVGGKFVNSDLQTVFAKMQEKGSGMLSVMNIFMKRYDELRERLKKDPTNKYNLIQIAQKYTQMMDMLQYFSAENGKKCFELDPTPGNPAGLNPFGNLLYASIGECSGMATKTPPGIDPWSQKTIIGFTKTRVLEVKHYYSVLKCAKMEPSEEDAKMMKDAEKDAK